MMDQRTIWRNEGIVLESVKIGQFIPDLLNTIMAKQIQWQAIVPKWRLYCNKWQDLKVKHIWVSAASNE